MEKEIFSRNEFAYKVRIIICAVSHFLPQHSCLVMVRDGIQAGQTPGPTFHCSPQGKKEPETLLIAADKQYNKWTNLGHVSC